MVSAVLKERGGWVPDDRKNMQNRLNLVALVLVAVGVIGGVIATRGMSLHDLVRSFPF